MRRDAEVGVPYNRPYPVYRRIQEEYRSGVGVFVRSCGIDQLIAIGPLAKHIAEGCQGGNTKTVYFETKEGFLKKQAELIQPDDLILVNLH